MDQQHETPNDLENIVDEPTQTDILKEVILDNLTTETLPTNSQVYNNDDNDDAQGYVNLTDINQVNANVFVHEGGEMISLALNSNFGIPPDETDNVIARKILAVADNNIDIEQEENQPNKFLVNENGDILRSGGENFSPGRLQYTLETNNSVHDMFDNIKIDESTSKAANVEIDKVLTEHTGVTSILATRDNTTSTNTAEKPNAPAQMGYIWGSGIVEWVRSNDPNEPDNVCYLCGETMEQGNRSPHRGTDDWDYPEVEHKIPCTTAFTIFPSMDNLRWYYPYYSVVNGETSRASVEYRRTPVNDKSMLAWWLSFTPTTYKTNAVSRSKAGRKQEFTAKNQMSSDRFEYLRALYISINRYQNHDITSNVYQNVKKLFRRFIQEKYGTSGVTSFNRTVFDYSWNVICLWLMEFAGSHKTCNQRKSQYNLMTIEGSRDAKNRKYNGGGYIGGSKKKSIDDAFNLRILVKGQKQQITEGVIFDHLTSIKHRYVKCCELYETVSSHNTLKRIHLGDKIEVYKRMHIWDNFRRIISYVKNIREAYFNKLPQSSNGRIDKINVAIGVVKEKIASIAEQYDVLYEKRNEIESYIKSPRLLKKAQDEIETELAALNPELVDLNKELDDLVKKYRKLESQDDKLTNKLTDELTDELQKPCSISKTLSPKKEMIMREAAHGEAAHASTMHPPSQKHTKSSRQRNEEAEHERKKKELERRHESETRKKIGITSSKKGKGGTRRKRRQLKSKHTRRVRKTKRKSKRTRRLRKPSRKSKTRRRVKK